MKPVTYIGQGPVREGAAPWSGARQMFAREHSEDQADGPPLVALGLWSAHELILQLYTRPFSG